MSSASDALTALLGSISPDANVYDLVDDFLEHGPKAVFPDYPTAFWIQSYVAVGLLGTLVLAFSIAYGMRARRGHLTFVVHDGGCSRLDWKTCLPLLYMLEAIFLIGFTFVFHQTFTKKNVSTAFFGTFWFLMHSALVSSHLLLMTTVLAASPTVRRVLMRRRQGPLILNGSAALGILVIGGVIGPAVGHGNTIAQISTLYHQALDVVQQARDAQNLQSLSALAPILLAMESTNAERATYQRAGSAVFAAVELTFIACAIVPSLILVRAVWRKIDQLENKTGVEDSGSSSTVMETEENVVHISCLEMDDLTKQGDEPRTQFVNLPPLPKDRPFGELVEKKDLLPARFQDIIRDTTQSRMQRAQGLRRVLAADARQFAAMMLQECAFFGITLYWCIEGGLFNSHAVDWGLGLVYPTWTFVLGAGLFCVFFVHDTLRPPKVRNDDMDVLKELRKRQRKGYNGDGAGGAEIACTQMVSIDYCEATEDDQDRTDSKPKRFT